MWNSPNRPGRLDTSREPATTTTTESTYRKTSTPVRTPSVRLTIPTASRSGLADGNTYDIVLWNYRVESSVSDRITVTYANKKRKFPFFEPRSVVFPVINLTPNKQ